MCIFFFYRQEVFLNPIFQALLKLYPLLKVSINSLCLRAFSFMQDTNKKLIGKMKHK